MLLLCCPTRAAKTLCDTSSLEKRMSLARHVVGPARLALIVMQSGTMCSVLSRSRLVCGLRRSGVRAQVLCLELYSLLKRMCAAKWHLRVAICCSPGPFRLNASPSFTKGIYQPSIRVWSAVTPYSRPVLCFLEANISKLSSNVIFRSGAWQCAAVLDTKMRSFPSLEVSPYYGIAKRRGHSARYRRRRPEITPTVEG
jgi:hypothetical protein